MSQGSTHKNAGGRIAVIDAIRGFAVLGILLANIQSWSGYKFLPDDYIQQLPYYGWDHTLRVLDHWLVDGRFYSIFSMLFGVGFGIQYLKNRDNQAPFISVHRRRMGFLLLFGVLHSLLWSGDILTLYALLAFLLIALRNLSDGAVLGLALALLMAFLIPQAMVMVLADPATPAHLAAYKVYPDIDSSQLYQAYGEGSWAEVFRMNLHNLYWRWLDMLPNGRISRVLGLFLLGFWLARTGYFYHKVFQWRQIVIFGALGVACAYGGQLLDGNLSHWANAPVDLVSKLLLVAAQVCTAMAYLSVIACIYRLPWGEGLLFPLTQIGRTAFTSYLSHSVIGIGIFYGVGLGYFGTMGLVQLWVLTLVIFAAQVVLLTLWLHFFKQGPVEWAWRCLTQKRWLSNRR